MAKSQIKITKWNPQGFAECLAGMDDIVKSEAEKLAARSAVNSEGRGHYTVESSNEPKFRDSQHGVTRPVVRVIADEEGSKDEAENKSMSRAVYDSAQKR